MQYLRMNVNCPVQCSAAGEFLSEVPWSHARRRMSSYELIIGVSEHVYIQEEENRFEVGPNDILLLMPGRMHGGYANSVPGVKFCWFHFELTDEPDLLTEEEMRQEADGIYQQSDPYWSVRHLYLPQTLRIENKERINVLINQILHVANANYLTHQSVNYLFTSLLIEISEHTLSSYSQRRSGIKGDVSFNKIAEWTRIHAKEPLTVSGIASKFNYNKDYLTRLFRQHTQRGPLEFIHQVRIGKAKELLMRTSMTVREIATEVGFQDEKYFMRLFKRYVNLTPRQFRNAYHKTFMNND